MSPEPDQRLKKYFEETVRIKTSVGLVDGLISELYDRFELIDSLRVFPEGERERKKAETTRDILVDSRLNSEGRTPLSHKDLLNGAIRYLATRIRVEPERKDFYLGKIMTVLPFIENHMNKDAFPKGHSYEDDILQISQRSGEQYPYNDNIWKLREE